MLQGEGYRNALDIEALQIWVLVVCSRSCSGTSMPGPGIEDGCFLGWLWISSELALVEDCYKHIRKAGRRPFEMNVDAASTGRD